MTTTQVNDIPTLVTRKGHKSGDLRESLEARKSDNESYRGILGIPGIVEVGLLSYWLTPDTVQIHPLTLILSGQTRGQLQHSWEKSRQMIISYTKYSFLEKQKLFVVVFYSELNYQFCSSTENKSKLPYPIWATFDCQPHSKLI